MLEVFDMIPDKEANKKLIPLVLSCSSKQEKSISLIFIPQSYFKVPKTKILNTKHYFMIKIPNKGELQKIASNQSSNIEFKDFMKLHKGYTKESF